MKLRDFLEKWGLSNLKLNLKFLEAEFEPKDPDREAAWELYIELLTRVATQRLSYGEGDELAALDSIHALFPLTREILRKHGSGCGEFAKIAIPMLNQAIRPFTAKWHRRSANGAFSEKAARDEFRDNLERLQPSLHSYTKALAAMADVEDLTDLEKQ